MERYNISKRNKEIVLFQKIKLDTLFSELEMKLPNGAWKQYTIYPDRGFTTTELLPGPFIHKCPLPNPQRTIMS